MDADLQQLKDIHLPHAIHSWPTAPGWMILFLVLAIIAAYLIHVSFSIHRRKKTVKFAHSKLKNLRKLCSENTENINITAEVSTLIRRTALYYFNRNDIAGLTGNDWLEFLNQSGNTTQFTDGIGRLLIDAPYSKHVSAENADLTSLFDLTQAWLSSIAKAKRKEKV